ncbi:zinc transporter ZntB [Oceanisphaera avium]|uniref:Zinc transporter ZntB n=1 Tax=Oceanisphaera avium TaxID=1903694 RepID=A0A1Y0CZ18_9GAMM|nr:zinc transporter ZntB [Oceanisphaera avium]ART80549.1 zinc transporter ZntB [Oceanisphaera avium]
MEHVPARCIYSLQLNGTGGMQALAPGSALTEAKATWLHLDYGQVAAKHWLLHTSLLNEAAKETLVGQSNRPKLLRYGDNLLLVLRGINHNEVNRPEEMVALRIFINAKLIISSRQRPLLSEQDLYQQLQEQAGPLTTADWLVEMCDTLTDRAGEFVDSLHDDILALEETVLEGQLPASGQLSRIRKQLILIRRYLSPQRDLVARLASEKISWLAEDDRRRLLDIAERLHRWLDDLDTGVARSAILADEINNMMSAATNKRAYQISILALLFLPATFLTGLLGVNLAGIPGAENPHAFWTFCAILGSLGGALALWLKARRWW